MSFFVGRKRKRNLESAGKIMKQNELFKVKKETLIISLPEELDHYAIGKWRFR